MNRLEQFIKALEEVQITDGEMYVDQASEEVVIDGRINKDKLKKILEELE